MNMESLRIGYGYDIHRLEDGDGIALGGTIIKCDKKVVAHSDGDVLIHAVCDALLGAASLGDIGKHFPDTDDKWKDVKSTGLLTATIDLLKAKDFHPINIDSTIILEKPHLAEHIPTMRNNLATATGLDIDRLSIKATRGETDDAIGKGEALAAHAICLIHQK